MTEKIEGKQKKILGKCHHCDVILKIGEAIPHYKKFHPQVYAQVVSEVSQ